MKELLKFWDLVNDTFGSEDIELAAEEWDFEIEKYTKENLSMLAKEEINPIFYDLISFVMDGFGIDNLGEIADMLYSIGLDDERVSELLD